MTREKWKTEPKQKLQHHFGDWVAQTRLEMSRSIVNTLTLQTAHFLINMIQLKLPGLFLKTPCGVTLTKDGMVPCQKYPGEHYLCLWEALTGIFINHFLTETN